MELLNRYLEAVRRHLPWRRQDDIIAELRANLESQLEDKEAEVGRKMTDAEMEAWLKQFGSPLQVAARYQPEQYLIGPALFPTYRYVLRLVVGWSAAIYAIAKTVDISIRGAGPEALADAALHLPWTLFTTAAMITLIFALVERSKAKIPGKLEQAAMDSDWPNLAALPPEARHVIEKRPKSYGQAIAEVIFGWVLLVWLLLVPHYPYLLMGPGAIYLEVTPFQLTHVWWIFYWCIVALNVVELTWRIVDLLRDRWQGPHTTQHLVKKVFGLVPLVVVLSVPGHTLVMLKDPADVVNAATAAQINHWAYTGFEVVAAITILQLLWTLGKMGLATYRKRLAAK